MTSHWYVYIIIGTVAAFFLWVCDKFRIIKSKPLRYFIVIFVSSIVCWMIYDAVVATA